MKKIMTIIALLIFVMCFTGCADGKAKLQLQYFEYFDTIIDITYYGEEADKGELDKRLREKLKYYHDLLGDFEEGSMVYKLNENGETENGSLAKLVRETLDNQKKVGTLDITKGKLFKLWKKALDEERLPSDDKIKEALKVGGDGSVIINGDKIILKDGARIDTGAICKGYLNDRLEEFFKEEGIDSYLISSGGNATVKGVPGDGRRRFAIGIQNPFKIGEVIETLYITDCSIVTSGDYQRFADMGGKRYHHIIDLRTGYPAENGKRSVTIIGPSSYMCDFLSTSIFLTEDDKIEEVMKAFPDYMYYTVYSDHTIRMDERLKKYLKSYGATMN